MKFALPIALLLPLMLAGCSGHKQIQAKVPPPPLPQQTAPEKATIQPSASTTPHSQPKIISDLPKPEGNVDHSGADDESSTAEEEARLADTIPPDAKPLEVETGIASWYGAPYHNRRGSNGEIYDMHAMTAAHRTLPLGSIVRVTNIKTGSTALVRITDRGPFISGRILDLSKAAAKKLDVYRAGLAKVRIEVLQSPAPIASGGKWAVQIGAFEKEKQAREMADHLERRYHTAKVLCFNSPVGDWWVRVRVRDDDHELAREVANATHTSEGAIFLVRLN